MLNANLRVRSRRRDFFRTLGAGVVVGLTVGGAAENALPHNRITQEKRSARSPADSAEPRYLLFWAPAERVAGLAKTIGERGDPRTRLLGFGLPCATFVLEKHLPEIIHRAFNQARQLDLAVMLQFDFHVDWSNRPDLWNWFDPKKPGYNPGNRRNVEWFGWDGPAGANSADCNSPQHPIVSREKLASRTSVLYNRVESRAIELENTDQASNGNKSRYL